MIHFVGRYREHWLVLGLYGLLSLLLTYPLPLQLNSHTVQATGQGWTYDALQYIWNMWWTKEALFHYHTWPAALSLIQYPAGVYHPFLLAVDYVGFAGLPFTLLFSPTVAHNSLCLLALILNGYTTYLFCRELTQHRPGSFIAGLSFAFLPNRMAHLVGGHVDLISTYWMPLYGLFLLRLLRRPGNRRYALFSGLTLSLSLWVQPLYLFYFLIPLTAAILVQEREKLRQAIPAGVLALLVAGVVTAPFLGPLLWQMAHGQADALQEPGTTAFSADLLGFVTPLSTNPALKQLGLLPNFAGRVVAENFILSEVAVYLGWIPLLLAGYGWRKGLRPGQIWAAMTLICAIFALGPLLKVNGALVEWQLDGLPTYLPLPHALLNNLPGLSLARAPGRIGFVVGFGVAVLAAYGLANSQWLNRRPLLLALSALILLEYLVYWPLPTLPLTQPAYFQQMATDNQQKGVLVIPMARRRVNQLALYEQTIHRQPLIGGRVFRELAGDLTLAAFLADLHTPPAEADLIPRATAQTIAEVDQACGVGYLLLHNDYVTDPGRLQNLYQQAFLEGVAVEPNLSLYQVPQTTGRVENLVYSLSEQWYGLENWGGRPARWLPAEGSIYLYAPQSQTSQLTFRALPLQPTESLTVAVNGLALPPLRIGDWISYTTPAFTLQAGVNEIRLAPAGGCQLVWGDPRCGGLTRGLNDQCVPTIQYERCLSLLVQDVAVVPAGQAPLNIPLANQLQLTNYDLRQTDNTLTLTLYWQALTQMTADYTIFVHLLGADGRPVAQNDHPPLNGLYPTSQWQVGEIFSHQVVLGNVPAGEYNLVAGLYTYPDLARLPVLASRPFAQDGLIWLQTVTVPSAK